MKIGDLAEYKELMIIAEEQGNEEEYEKFYKIFTEAYKEYTVTIWLLNPKNKKKTAILKYKKTDKFLDSNNKNLTLAEKEICTGIFSFCRQQGFEEVIEGTYGNINE
mgnify:CR=1 FL=1